MRVRVGRFLGALLAGSLLASAPRLEAIDFVYQIFQVNAGQAYDPAHPDWAVNFTTRWLVVNKVTHEIVASGKGLVPSSVVATYGGGATATAATGAAATGAAGAGEAAAAVGGATAAGTAGIGAVIIVVAVAAVISYDCWENDECLWTTMRKAGGWSVSLGVAPSPAAAPQGVSTAACGEPLNLSFQCRNGTLRKSITEYYTWVLAPYWTCGEIWDQAMSGDRSPQQFDKFDVWKDRCDKLAAACVAATCQVCAANGIKRSDCP